MPKSVDFKAKVASEVQQAVKDNLIYCYRSSVGGQGPTWYQEAIHQGGVSQVGVGSVNKGRLARERWCFLPNQVGKTYACIADALMMAMGIHPHVEMKPPIEGAIITTSHLKSVQIARPQVEEMLPAEAKLQIFSKNESGQWYNKNGEKPSRLMLPEQYGGSTIHFMSMDQSDWEYESLRLSFVFVDEQPPESLYNQLQIRLLRHRGYLLCAMTPWVSESSAEGISWTADRILENENLPEERRSDEIWIAPSITMYDAPWLGDKAIKEWKKKCHSPEEYKARFHGLHMRRSGVILNQFRDDYYKEDDPANAGHLLPHKFVPAPQWTQFMLFDPSSPSGTSAALWILAATDCEWYGITFKSGDLIVWKEYKQKDMIVSDHAANMRAISAGSLVDFFYIDGRFCDQPADANSGETYQQMYARHGLRFWSWGGNLIEHEIEATKQYISGTLTRTSRQPGLFVVESCRALRQEIKKYVYPRHRTGPDRGQRKRLPTRKMPDIHLIDCLKAACKMRLKAVRRSWEETPNSAQYIGDESETSVTGAF